MESKTVKNLLKDGVDISLIAGFEAARTYADKRDFVQGKMAAEIENGKFYLTEFMMLPNPIRDLVGDILFGVEYEKNEQIRVDEEFTDIKVKLTTMDGGDIAVKTGHIRSARSILFNRGNFSSVKSSKSITIKEPKVVTYKSGSYLSLRHAYLALAQKGWLVCHSPAFCKKNPEGITVEAPESAKKV